MATGPRSHAAALDRACAALAAGQSADPFAVLGPHRAGRQLTLRAIHPAATAIDAMVDGVTHRLHPRPEPGLFEASLDLEPDAAVPDYRLALTFADGRAARIDDPYRYGQVFTPFDLHLFGEGNLNRAFEKFGAHRIQHGLATGVHFAVWAPNAQRVSVIGDFNGWDGRVHPMRQLVPSGVWEIFIPDLPDWEKYKFEIRTHGGDLLEKTDPFGFAFEVPPRTAAVVRDLRGYTWGDEAWMAARRSLHDWIEAPMSIYEVHLGSWARNPGEGDRSLTYRELADRLPAYVKDLGFTHIELLPVMEHPFTGSWGYQVLGFFAPTSRFGPPEDFKYLVDRCHQAGLGVILDWVPGHFPKDAHGLARFDGSALYEHADPRQGEHQDWGTLIFNYGRNEVRNFLLSNALFWLEEYHADGLRVDAVASMLYLDYSRRAGEWIPNAYGGRENLDAIAFLQKLNVLTHGEHPGTITAAEESTAWPGVSRPVHVGGLGFTYKWNMGWMHDMLRYAEEDPVHRRWHHNLVTFSMIYAFTENFVLPFSHDEVVYGKRALLDKMPGDAWQKCATLRTLLAYMWGHPGKKLLFMGAEFGQWREWHHDRSLDWHLLDDPAHAGLRRFVQALNWHYRAEPALHECDFTPDGFRWIDCNDNEHSIISFVRYARGERDAVVMLFNFTPVPRYGYRIGVPDAGAYAELLNSDAAVFGGGDVGNGGRVLSEAVPSHGFAHSLALTVPPLGCLLLKRRG
ncbi:MAG: 1,4-alpha-glucan branching protein GlgB [Vicinamibacterales bacterium]